MASWDNTPTVILTGTIAGALVCAEDALLAAEKRLEQLLHSLYVDGWDDYEIDRNAWGIDVYGITPSPPAVEALFRVGFAKVTEHAHSLREFKRCACRLSTRTA